MYSTSWFLFFLVIVKFEGGLFRMKRLFILALALMLTFSLAPATFAEESEPKDTDSVSPANEGTEASDLEKEVIKEEVDLKVDDSEPNAEEPEVVEQDTIKLEEDSEIEPINEPNIPDAPETLEDFSDFEGFEDLDELEGIEILEIGKDAPFDKGPGLYRGVVTDKDNIAVWLKAEEKKYIDLLDEDVDFEKANNSGPVFNLTYTEIKPEDKFILTYGIEWEYVSDSYEGEQAEAFNSGMYLVGTDIKAGTYQVTGYEDEELLMGNISRYKTADTLFSLESEELLDENLIGDPFVRATDEDGEVHILNGIDDSDTITVENGEFIYNFNLEAELVETKKDAAAGGKAAKSETPKKDDKKEEKAEGGKLPATATNNYNMLVVGFMIIAAGSAFILFNRRKVNI